MKIFIIGGKSGSGKKEVAKMIKEYYIYKLKQCAITGFTKYLKNFAVELTDWDGVSENKPRDFLQEFGAKVRRIDERFLTRRMIEDMTIYENSVDVVVIDDARLPIEIEDIKNNFEDVTSILVVNQFSPSKLTLKQQADPTEIAFETYDGFDYVIANDDINATKEKIFKILGEIENE